MPKFKGMHTSLPAFICGKTTQKRSKTAHFVIEKAKNSLLLSAVETKISLLLVNFKTMDIKKLRKERKVMLKEISEKTGINCVTLRKLEQGNGRQDFSKVKAYLSAIGYSLIVIDSAQLISATKEAK